MFALRRGSRVDGGIIHFYKNNFVRTSRLEITNSRKFRLLYIYFFYMTISKTKRISTLRHANIAMQAVSLVGGTVGWQIIHLFYKNNFIRTSTLEITKGWENDPSLRTIGTMNLRTVYSLCLFSRSPTLGRNKLFLTRVYFALVEEINLLEEIKVSVSTQRNGLLSTHYETFVCQYEEFPPARCVLAFHTWKSNFHIWLYWSMGWWGDGVLS